MLDLSPVILECPFFVEVGAVIEVMAFHTAFLRTLKRKLHGKAKGFTLGFADRGTFTLCGDVACPGAVTILAAISGQVRAYL